MAAAWKLPNVAACKTWANNSTVRCSAKLPSSSQRRAARTKLAISTRRNETRARIQLMPRNINTSATTPRAQSIPMTARL
ncbi:hypothetical protein D3C72_2236630 [compost metagenome]